MAITRRQFVVTLGSMAAALGLSQADLTKLSEAFAGGSFTKPQVVWVHGAECTGCSTSALGLFEDYNQKPVLDINDPAKDLSLLAAVQAATASDFSLTLHTGYNFDAASAVTIQDVLIDVIDLKYHETVMGAGGDLGFQYLNDWVENGATDFYLVVEGAVQVKSMGGAWADDSTASQEVPWCSIGMGATSGELSFDHVVAKLADNSHCQAVIAIGQCACYGGYPACVSPNAQFAGMSQTPAYGVFDFLSDTDLSGLLTTDAAGKVANVPGCPANPWWFVLTVVLALAGLVTFDDAAFTGVDYGRRVKRVYPTTVHNGLCPRYNDWKGGKFAAKPGDSGCLMKLGCKGIATKSLCSVHGWNGLNPANPSTWEYNLGDINGSRAGFCVAAGAPCMGCTEKGYPDVQVPFVKIV